MSKWRTIESAPTDGREILVFGGHLKCELNFSETSGVCKVYGGRTAWTVVDTCHYSMWVEKPTHWMPLPEPPEIDEVMGAKR